MRTLNWRARPVIQLQWNDDGDQHQPRRCMAPTATALRWMKRVPGETNDTFMTQFNMAVRNAYPGALTAEARLHIQAAYIRSSFMMTPTPDKCGFHLFFSAL